MARPYYPEDREELQTRWLMAFSARGLVTDACQQTGISRQTVEQWKESDPSFLEAYESVREDVHDSIRAEIKRRAFGYEKQLHYQGRLTGDTVKEYSDKLLMFVANSTLPECRQRNVAIEITDASGIREQFLDRLLAMTERMSAEDADTDSPIG